jgi:hypothetical protein
LKLQQRCRAVRAQVLHADEQPRRYPHGSGAGEADTRRSVPTDNASRSPERLMSATARRRECRLEPPLSARVSGGSVSPPLAGGVVLEGSAAIVVVLPGTLFCRDSAGFSVEPPASTQYRHRPGREEAPEPQGHERHSPPTRNRMMKRRLKAAGLPGHFSPHSFRVATVTDLLARTCRSTLVSHTASFHGSVQTRSAVIPTASRTVIHSG